MIKNLKLISIFILLTGCALLRSAVPFADPLQAAAAAAELQRSILNGATRDALALLMQGAPLISSEGGQTALMLAAYVDSFLTTKDTTTLHSPKAAEVIM